MQKSDSKNGKKSVNLSHGGSKVYVSKVYAKRQHSAALGTQKLSRVCYTVYDHTTVYHQTLWGKIRQHLPNARVFLLPNRVQPSKHRLLGCRIVMKFTCNQMMH